MKKVLLLSLGLVMGLGAFAQDKAVKPVLSPYKVSLHKEALGTDVVKGEAKFANYPFRNVQGGTVVNEFYAEAEGMYSVYDLQTNSMVANRMYQSKDGHVAVTATMSNDEYDVNQMDRGTGYNFILNGQMDNCGDVPTVRMEANATGEDLRTGWPTVAPYGETGEILINHSEGLKYWTREIAGQGVWNGPHAIPNPEGLEGQDDIDFQLAWPRVVTTGENNDVVHIFACAQNTDEQAVGQFYLRTSDLQNWDVQWSPLVQDDMHLNVYSADDYAASANGDNIAVVYCSGLSTHVMLYESNDAGLTWTSRIVWECPIYGLDWETDEASIFDGLYAPTQATVAIGVDGVSHVALTVGCYKHDALGTSYNLYYGVQVDGIAYWNDTTSWEYEINGTDTIAVPSPIRSIYDNNPNNALKMWWPVPEDTNYIMRNISTFCAWMPPHPESGLAGIDNEKIYTGSEGGTAGDYLTLFGGCSAYPSIAVDPAGNLALAYSAPDALRLYDDAYYLRNIYVTYKPVDSVYWNSAYNIYDNFYKEFQHTGDEATFISAVSASVNENEFWFSCYSDDIPGFYFGSVTSQATSNRGTVNVFKYSPVGAISDESEGVGINETEDVVRNIFPNPASEYICISSEKEANATITFANIAGQTVKVVNKNLTTGDNTIVINDLTSGVYFCTVTANGYSKTSKVVVK